MENHEALIGKKVFGFKFKETDGLYFNERMYNLIGEIGTILEYTEYDDGYVVEFKNGDTWSYPADEIRKHLLASYFLNGEEIWNKVFGKEFQELPDGVLMEVSDDESFKNFWTYSVFGKKNGEFVAWSHTGRDAITCWKYARPIKETSLTLTLEEIAERLGVDKVTIKE